MVKLEAVTKCSILKGNVPEYYICKGCGTKILINDGEPIQIGIYMICDVLVKRRPIYCPICGQKFYKNS
jgi:hypothetical protein